MYSYSCMRVVISWAGATVTSRGQHQDQFRSRPWPGLGRDRGGWEERGSPDLGKLMALEPDRHALRHSRKYSVLVHGSRNVL